MASTQTMLLKVNFPYPLRNSTTNINSFVFCFTGRHHNIYNTEEGTPKPPSVEKMASTTTTRSEVGPMGNKTILDTLAYLGFPLTGPTESPFMLLGIWGNVAKDRSDQTHPRGKLQRSGQALAPNKEEKTAPQVSPRIHHKPLSSISKTMISLTGPGERCTLTISQHHISHHGAPAITPSSTQENRMHPPTKQQQGRDSYAGLELMMESPGKNNTINNLSAGPNA